MNKEINLDNSSFCTEYKICSNLGAMENARYFQQIEAQLFLTEYGETDKKLVGRLSGVKLLLGEAANDEWDAFSIFDNTSETLELGSVIYDFDNEDWNEELNEIFQNDLIDPNILLLQSIEILPEYRGNKIGNRFVKDFILNFVQGCAIVAIDKEPFYIQTNFKEKYIEDSFTKLMNYQSMISDYEKITYMLLHYFISLGFQYFPEFNEQYLFMCPSQINEKFAKVEFDI